MFACPLPNFGTKLVYLSHLVRSNWYCHTAGCLFVDPPSPKHDFWAAWAILSNFSFFAFLDVSCHFEYFSDSGQKFPLPPICWSRIFLTPQLWAKHSCFSCVRTLGGQSTLYHGFEPLPCADCNCTTLRGRVCHRQQQGQGDSMDSFSTPVKSYQRNTFWGGFPHLSPRVSSKNNVSHLCFLIAFVCFVRQHKRREDNVDFLKLSV